MLCVKDRKIFRLYIREKESVIELSTSCDEVAMWHGKGCEEEPRIPKRQKERHV
jgi:hypothetical protein